MVMIISTSLRASSAMLAAAVAPASTRPATALCERSDTVSWWPALIRLRAIGPPMLPSPIKPIFMWLPRCCCQAVGRAVHAAVRSGGRCSYTPLWEPCPWAKGLFPWACFARCSQRGRCSYRPLWEPRPRGEWRAARARSVVLEVRLALLDKRLHTFGLVGGGEDRMEYPTLEAHPFGQAGFEHAVHTFLGHHHAGQGLFCNDLSGLEGFLQQLIHREDLGHQARLFGFLGVHLATGQAHFHGLGLADGAGQALGAADSGQYAQVDFRLAEAGVVGGIDEVADHRQLATTTQGITGNSSDQRLAAVGDAVGGGKEVVHEYVGVLQIDHLLDVGAGGEGLAGAGQYHAADVRIVLELVQGLVQLIQHLGVEGVQRLGAVQGDQTDALAGFDQNGFKAHVTTPIKRGRPNRWPACKNYLRVMVVLTSAACSS